MAVWRGVRNTERLRRLEALTDAALSRLDVSDLLDELLDRVRDLLDVDTAAILLLDEHSGQLVATAAKGLEDEVRRGFRAPVGRGFAGSIAASRQPRVLADVTPADVLNPVLIEKGIRSLLGVPIFAAGEVVGVLHVGTTAQRRFTDDDILLLQAAADRAGVAGQVRSRKLEQAAAVALQRSLLPNRLPSVPGVSLAARYVPGHEFGVGGDWYDVFTLPSGHLGMVIGDVSGHGLASAVVMGRVRSALRAYALTTDDPAEVMTLLDRKVRHFEAGALTTALYATLSPDRTVMTVSSAGHLPPVLAVPESCARLAQIPVDPPLGIGRARRPRRSTSVDLPEGGLMLCYTDGLVERRDAPIDDGLDALTALVTADDPEQVCTTVMASLGSDQPGDDVALLAVQRHAAGTPRVRRNPFEWA
ncbi:PP2C family protein-serine/threonine phosphatase [Actinoplanes sp. NPDC051343]|uniref:PP2C family protein-serine/threonine phosphatase n=1 Tax=Actinoplanes sp. NPDC051343 TaxID=3363906 RepID=UPI0037957563